MTDPTRWIETVQDVVWFPEDPATWSDAEIDVLIARLNADGLRRLFEAAADAANADEEVAS